MITGLGIVSPYGAGFSPYWDGLMSGRSAITSFRASERLAILGPGMGGVVGDRICAEPVGRRKTWMARTAFAEALCCAGMESVPDDALIVVASQVPRSAGPQEFAREFESPDLTGSAGASVPVVHVPHACASAAFATAYAFDLLRAGEADVAFVVGVVALNPYDLASMGLVRALSDRPARPFDTGRDGISLGEGGGVVVLETEQAATRRGRRPRIELRAASTLLGGENVAASDTDLIERCALTALERAGDCPIDYVQAHATGTPQGDEAEAMAVDRVARRLGWPRGVPMSSHKGAIGHLLHASTVPSIAAAIGFLITATVPGTAGLTNPIPLERIHLPAASGPSGFARNALVNSFGFYGNHASLVISRHDQQPTPQGVTSRWAFTE
ncbi:beta-ketoacyl synthase N-terminal-like domain-containing protein [Nonomuraea sp. NPDC005650]|uniref:beta-ketoacyl synthase N-terminal-like domain-containing protein n=1 Tax=Nonomuraea sp. NPDC005650 TaxID=3157045 RepID=UPI0033ACA571